jgi:hypothetical protein
MITPEAEEKDLALTAALQRYITMEPKAAYDAIAAEWPEQTTILIREFLFKTLCGSCDGMLDFVLVELETGRSFMTTLCDCDGNGISDSGDDNAEA